MECSVGFPHGRASTFVRPPLTCTSQRRKIGWLRAKTNDEDDPFLQIAINRATLRFQETHRPEPLFFDPYAGCFVPPHIQMDTKKLADHYCLATKFIDDRLLHTVNNIDGLKQVVLLTDGMDTRPYRLNWPTSTIIFDISPSRVFKRAAKKLEGVGAKIPRSCLFLHVPLETNNIQQTLCMKGFNGNRPSIWAIQGLPVMTLASFEEILFIVGSLTMNGCNFLGELPSWFTETEIGIKVSLPYFQNGLCSLQFLFLLETPPVGWSPAQPNTNKSMDKLFMSNGFRVDMISYDEVVSVLGKELASGDYKNILFVAEQLRFSDDQMEAWRREFQRVEEEGDEEGFEEL